MSKKTRRRTPRDQRSRSTTLDDTSPKRIRELIEDRGARLVYLPSYSPDLNPIEQAFSKIKNILRKLGARTHQALLEALAEALCKVTPWDAAGWFDHCGYEVEVQYL